MKGKPTDKHTIKEEELGEDQQNLPQDESFDDAKTAEETASGADKSAPVAGDASSDWKDKYLRLSAEFDNYRKRTLREKMDLIATGGEDVIKPILGVVDDFDRALAAMKTVGDVAAVREGVELISLKLADVLKSKGVVEIEAVGLPLDTDSHEAVAKVPVEDAAKKGKVIDVIQKGYKLKDKVIRYAKVVVGE